MSEHAEIDPRDNPESRTAEGGASQTGARASSGGQPPVPHRVPGEEDPAPAGTGQGSPLDGVLIDPEDAAQAVPGDEGPEHPGTR